MSQHCLPIVIYSEGRYLVTISLMFISKLLYERMKTILTRAPLWRTGIVTSVVIACCAAVTMTILSVSAANFTPLTSQINSGETSANVTNLQIFLAANPSIYPEGKVTGYFGPLTQAAVSRFQAQYGLDQVGRVGPLTLAKINTLINGGGWTSGADVSGPAIYAVSQNVSSNSATFTWNTDEYATAKIFYNTGYVTMNEGDINSVGFGSTNGSTVTNDGLARASQQVTINGLMPNTLYHYVIVATDAAGNVSVWNPNTTLRTNL